MRMSTNFEWDCLIWKFVKTSPGRFQMHQFWIVIICNLPTSCVRQVHKQLARSTRGALRTYWGHQERIRCVRIIGTTKMQVRLSLDVAATVIVTVSTTSKIAHLRHLGWLCWKLRHPLQLPFGWDWGYYIGLCMHCRYLIKPHLLGISFS